MRLLAASAALLLPLLAAFHSPSRPAAPRTHSVTLNGHTFTLPVGFTIELAAALPLVDRPIVADLDDEGRLYVACSSGSNDPVKVQLEKRPHRVVRLEDTDGDGRYDRATVFADRMMLPQGVMWLDGSVYVAAPPSIWKLTDRDGDGVAEERVEWFAGKTLTGCANDLHGPYRGPDGWVYWAKGAFAQQTYPRPGRPDLVTRAAHLFRARPDGTGAEPVMTGGMDNPVDVVFTPDGERVFTTTFFQHPGGGRRDGLIHAVYGGLYGKDHSVVHDPAHPWTGPDLMPVLTHMGPAAPCGLHRYESASFGPEYRDSLFACQFNLHKVSRHVLVPSGATFTTRDEDFLTSSNLDFHPTDVLEDADGSLLVIDTGGWYKLCCPTSQLHKPDVLGAIYRVRRAGASRLDDPRGKRVAWARESPEALAALLGDPRPVVRRRAAETLAKRGAAAVPALRTALRRGRPDARLQAVWAATRIDHAGARAAVRAALADDDPGVRQAALHSASLWRDKGAFDGLARLLETKAPANRRAAAEALGRVGDPRAVPALLKALAAPADRVLEHSLIYALVEINDRAATAKGLAADSPRVRRAALIALEGMDSGKLRPAEVTASLDAGDPRLREAAWWVAGRHPDWGETMAGHFRGRLADATLSQAEAAELTTQLARFARGPAVRALLADRLAAGGAGAAEKRLVLRAMSSANVRPVPGEWAEALLANLATPDEGLLRETLAAARALPLAREKAPVLSARLLGLGEDARRPAGVRLAALAAVPGGLPEPTAALFAFLRDRLDRDGDVRERALAADVLARARLSGAQLGDLAGALKSAAPMELDRVVEAFAQSKDPGVGEKLVAGLRASPVRAGLRADRVRSRVEPYGPRVRKLAEPLLAEIDAGGAGQRENLEKLLASLGRGDIRRGQAVFNSPKAACASCHAIGYLGGKVGPDLTRIGGVRTDRDLLESIVYPSASFVRSYEPVQVTTRRGTTLNGLLRQDGPDGLVLATGATEEVRVPRREIEAVEPGRVSIMPAGVDRLLTRQELADLVAFLRACR